MKIFFLFVLFISSSARAAGTPYGQLSQTDQRAFLLHASASYAANLTGGLVLEKLGMKPGWAILLSSALVAGANYFKEKKLDATYSGSDMSGGMVGVGASAITFAILEF